MQESEIKTEVNTGGESWVLNLSPAKMAVLMTLIIFVVELFVMLLLDRLPTFSPLAEAVVDSSFLIVFLVPAYIAFYRPFWKARQKSELEIRQLYTRLTEASEEERRRIALDLHDHCDQTLVALQRTVELVQAQVIDTSEEAAALCQEIDELLGRLNHDVRAVSSALHPPQLEELGVNAALRQYVRQLQGHNVGISIEFIEKGSPYPVSKQKGIAIYRIVQEAVKNALEHAEPGLVRVYLEYAPASVSISIVDDGRGFDARKAALSGGVGLVSMRERARALGGRLVVHSEPGRGTSLRVNFKL